MSWRDDEEKAYRTKDDLLGRSIRRGTKKGLMAVAGALIGGAAGGPVGLFIGAMKGLFIDALTEAPKAINRSQEKED